jgi:hypothetical protein
MALRNEIQRGDRGHRADHEVIHAAVGEGLPTSILWMTDTQHEAYHNTIHAAIGQGLPTGDLTTGHISHHQVIHASLNFTPTPPSVHLRSVDISGVSALESTGRRVRNRAVGISALSDISVNIPQTFSRSVDISGVSDISVTGLVGAGQSFSRQVALSSVSSIAVSGAIGQTFSRAVALSGVSNIAASGVIVGGAELPEPDVIITAGQNIQNIIDQNPNGTIYKLVGTFNLSGQVKPSANDWLFCDPGGALLQAGAFSGTGVSCSAANVKLTNLRIGNGLNSGVQLGNNTIIEGGEIFECFENGAGSNQTLGGIIDGVEIHHNGNNGAQGHNSGGVKVTATGIRGTGAGFIVRNCHIHHNVGNGFWWDVDAGTCLNYNTFTGDPDDLWPAGEKDMHIGVEGQGSFETDPDMPDTFDDDPDFDTWTPQPDLVEDCLIEDNESRGIFWEVSRGPCIIRRNQVYRNNTDGLGNGAGIGVSAAKNCLIEDNDSRNNTNWDISIGQITRDPPRPWYPGYYVVKRVIVRNNQVGSLSKIRGLPGFEDPLPGVSGSGNFV